jgi:hypothetical protein
MQSVRTGTAIRKASARGQQIKELGADIHIPKAAEREQAKRRPRRTTRLRAIPGLVPLDDAKAPNCGRMLTSCVSDVTNELACRRMLLPIRRTTVSTPPL